MSSNPIVLAVVVADLVVILSFAAAVTRGVRILLGWREGEASRGQLELERAAERLSLEARAATVVFLASGVFLVAAIASVLPSTVPGAMCGTGVVQAMGAAGQRALWLRGFALALLAVWWVLDELSGASKRAALALTTARSLLVAAPAVTLASFESTRALFSLDVQTPVDCCTVVYESVRAVSAEGSGASITAPWLPLVLVHGALLVVIASTLSFRRRPSSASSLLLAILALLWVPVAWFGLVRELAAYHYGVLQHDCPWCLFTARHGLVGYALFGAVALVTFHAIAILVARRAHRAGVGLEVVSERRWRRSSGCIAIWVLLFTALAAGPALLWRWRFGVWIDGS